jgi:hypothetical protein
MTYDDASWHYGGDFPKDLPPEAGATHIGMFLAWALLLGLAGTPHLEHSRDLLARLKQRSITPGQFFIDACDEKFTDEDLNKEGNEFAAAYYDLEKGSFLADYESACGQEVPTLYHVPDTWQTYDRLKPILDQRFRMWQKERHPGA